MIRKILLAIDSILLAISILIGFSYSYYVANVKYVNNTETVILSDVLNLIFDDTKEINVEDIIPGDSFTKTFTVENTSDKATTFNILFNSTINEFNRDLVYELYEGDKLVVSTSLTPKTGDISYIKQNISIDATAKKEYTLKITFIYKESEDQNDLQGKKFSSTIEINTTQINDEIKTATNYLLLNNQVQESSLNLTTKSLENGLYKTIDTNTGNPIYFYRGEVTNNYVSFANELWRIIRINEDGSIRVIKDTNVNTNYSFNENSEIENAYNYVNSNIATNVNEYYNTILKDYQSMLSSEDYCVDTMIVKNDYYKESEENKSYSEYTPTYKCNNSTKLNIGLISYDEAVLAGLYYNLSNSNNYLIQGTNKNTWTLSKAGKYQYSNDYYAWKINDSGSIYEASVNSQNISYRPVINLKSTLNLTGNGTIENPYVFSE